MKAFDADMIGALVALAIPNHPSINGWYRIGRWSWPRMKRASRWLELAVMATADLAVRMFVRVPDVDPIPRARVVGRSSRARRGRPGP